MPAEVCRLCGEEWLVEEVSRTLERLTDEVREKGSQLEVFSYPGRKSAKVA